ncbi:MAG: hypothetical protein K2V38_02900, partial [Gemmataceae bacterium]|nr:hypothetical protein [Gemmataceae bacterium]
REEQNRVVSDLTDEQRITLLAPESLAQLIRRAQRLESSNFLIAVAIWFAESAAAIGPRDSTLADPPLRLADNFRPWANNTELLFHHLWLAGHYAVHARGETDRVVLDSQSILAACRSIVLASHTEVKSTEQRASDCGVALRAIMADARLVSRLSQEHEPGEDAVCPPEKFGPMWTEPPPNWWAEALAQPPFPTPAW